MMGEEGGGGVDEGGGVHRQGEGAELLLGAGYEGTEWMCRVGDSGRG